jgi:uncharacterized protein (UPF0332 family)
MLFDWDKYKELAEELRLKDDEAAKRSAISRLYYSVYWKARIFLEKEEPNLNVPPDNSHAFVWRKYQNKGITRNKIFSDGKRLKEYRQEADYEPEIEKLEDVVETSFRIAETIITNLNTIAGKK